MAFSPLLQPPYFEEPIGIVHWALFGFGGALLATVVQMRKKDTFRVGEDEGDNALRQMLLSLLVGSISAVVLNIAITTGLFGGKAFPKLNPNVGEDQLPQVLNAFSVFWAMLAGFSGGFIEKVFGAGEKPMVS